MYADAEIRVYKLGEDEDGAVVILPQPPIDGSTIVKVRKTQIADTPSDGSQSSARFVSSQIERLSLGSVRDPGERTQKRHKKAL